MERAFRTTARSAGLPAAVMVGALFSACLAASSTAQAASCKSEPAPSIDWQDCPKANLVLEQSALDGANLFSADFSYTDLRGSSLIGANFEKATLIRSSLAGSKADKANFNRVEGYRTVFSQVSAAGASFASAELQRADFTGADLTGVDFEKAELGRANFTDAVITGARFPMANLARAQLQAAKFEGPLAFDGAFLFLTHIEGMDLSQATGLQQWQIDQACGDQNTKLPADLKAPADWPCASN
ncbi:pentapeptide repeat-containing protein [Mesorhizobium sp. LHD-90]|uniref:pentapeptide repeat-containing protein n=1 Tax=Mesorhizobium sp. LHD-90 TaxID=3071414 RepID=UPI0027E01BB4|nr:pentapeptide repeat-containing protein [Mesorhizobium sp. LHD-90]MDQ6436196.1 pentapeptide repeat-containing protein [Mesorhizobium sp. LHD-90]